MSSLKRTQMFGSPLGAPRDNEQAPTSSELGEQLRKTPFPAALGRSRAPAARRTSELEGQPAVTPLPDGAPGWMRRAHFMVQALQAAIASGRVSDTTEAAIERAFAAWELHGASDQLVARVAHLAHRAHTALHSSPRGGGDRAIAECAQVLQAGLPSSVRRRLSDASVFEIVRAMVPEADPWPAVVKATSRLLGWDRAIRAHSAHAVRIALERRSDR